MALYQCEHQVERRFLNSDQHRERNRATYHVLADDWAAARTGMDSVLESLRLSPGEERELTGSRPLARASIRAYKKHYRGLRYFCAPSRRLS